MKIRQQIPNIVTLAALGTGFTAIHYATQEKWDTAIMLVMTAAILDTIDGWLARALGSAGPFGAQLDTLADYTNFGIVPGLMLYKWHGYFLPKVSYVILVMYVACAALRLARFTVAAINPKKDKAEKSMFFVGVPTPAAAILALSPIAVDIVFGTALQADKIIDISSRDITVYIHLYLMMIALLMISRIPTYSLKALLTRKSSALIVALVLLSLSYFFILLPWHTLLFVGSAYIMSLPFSMIHYLERRSRSK